MTTKSIQNRRPYDHLTLDNFVYNHEDHEYVYLIHNGDHEVVIEENRDGKTFLVADYNITETQTRILAGDKIESSTIAGALRTAITFLNRYHMSHT